jgi:hypothetical protein
MAVAIYYVTFEIASPDERHRDRNDIFTFFTITEYYFSLLKKRFVFGYLRQVRISFQKPFGHVLLLAGNQGL